jgi:transposase
MVKGGGNGKPKGRHVYSEEFRQEAVQMLLDGHSATSVARRLGLSSPTLLYGWK